MSFKIKLEPKALQELKKLPQEIRQRTINKLKQIKEKPAHFLEKLTKIKGSKLRVGDYRLIVEIFEKERVLAIKFIGHRKNIYKKYKTI